MDDTELTARTPSPTQHGEQRVLLPHDENTSRIGVRDPRNASIADDADFDTQSERSVGPARSSTAPFVPFVAASRPSNGPPNLRIGLWAELVEWGSEAIACVLFVIFFAALVVTLLLLDGKLLPKTWSLNSVLSFYTVVFKGCMVYVLGSAMTQNQWRWFRKERSLHDVVRYDQMTEPLGAFLWIVRWGIQEPVTSIAAVVLITAILVDPFVQQLAQYVDCSSDIQTVIATMPRTNYFNPTMIHAGPLDMTPLPDDISAWNSGFFSSPPDIVAGCSTGNCTYSKLYSTVGWCSQCDDISSQLEMKCNASADDATYTLPNNLSMKYNSRNGSLNVLAMGSDKDGVFYMISSRGACGNNTRPEDLNTNNAMPGCEVTEATADRWDCRGYGAAKCLVGPCMKTYNATMVSGVLNETTLESTVPLDDWGFNPYTLATVDTQCIKPKDRDELNAAGYRIDPSKRWLAYNISYPETFNLSAPLPDSPPFPQSMLADGCMYMISQQFVVGYMEYFLIPLFAGTVRGNIGPSATVITYDGSQVLQHLYNFGYSDFAWLDSIFNNASKALTSRMRQNGEENLSKGAEGVTHHFAICVEIEWEWVALPAVVAGATLLLLLLTMWNCRRANVPIWKSSPLAFVFHTVHQTTGTVSAPVSTSSALASMSAMEEEAKTTTIQLDTLSSSIQIRPHSSPDVPWYRRAAAKQRA